MALKLQLIIGVNEENTLQFGFTSLKRLNYGGKIEIFVNNNKIFGPITIETPTETPNQDKLSIMRPTTDYYIDIRSADGEPLHLKEVKLFNKTDVSTENSPLLKTDIFSESQLINSIESK